MTDLRANIRERLETAVVDDPATGAFRCRRDVFTDPDLFDLEMKHIFEGNWVYLAHESQIPENNDYFTTLSAASRSSSPATRLASSTPSSMPARTAARCSAGASMATRAASPARSMAGRSATRASC